MIKRQSVAITGVGVVSPLGNTARDMWGNLLAGHAGPGPITQFDATRFPTGIGAEVKDFVPTYPDAVRSRRYTTRMTRFALQAASEAFADAGITPTATDAARWGVVTGSGMMTAEFEYFQRFQHAIAPDGMLNWSQVPEDAADFFNVRDLGKTTANTALALLSETYGLRGYMNAVHTACASGGQALGLALQAMRRGDADYMLAGGFDSMLNPLGLSSFCLLGALSTYNDTPHTASRPFDFTRNGFVLGEGAAFLILEDPESARARGARIYATLAGEGNSLSAYRITDSHPNGDGAIQAIYRALHDAGCAPEQVDHINAHGTSTKMNDLSETNAIKTVFADRAHRIPISATKSQTGHLIAAAGALEAVIASLALHHGTIPQTANLTHPDPECDLDYVTEGTRYGALRAVLSNSFGFGGSNSCLLFKHSEWDR